MHGTVGSILTKEPLLGNHYHLHCLGVEERERRFQPAEQKGQGHALSLKSTKIRSFEHLLLLAMHLFLIASCYY